MALKFDIIIDGKYESTVTTLGQVNHWIQLYGDEENNLKDTLGVCNNGNS